jgi:hypothetical protein
MLTMRRLAYTFLVLTSLVSTGCYQRTLAPELSTNESDVKAFRQDMGMEAPADAESGEETAAEVDSSE